MAKQDTKTNDQHRKQAVEIGRSSQAAAAQPRRQSASPLETLMTPFDFFRMTPFSAMKRMAEAMDRVFGEALPASQATDDALWSPAIEVSESGGQYKIRAELA
jgi:HSP20 family molecular chaperone IbpA